MLDMREQEIDKAWAQHDPDRAKIPVQVWRALRIYKRGITGDAARIAKACDDAKTLRALLDDFTRKGQVGRQRALQKIKHRLEPARVEAVDKTAVIACWPEPRDSVFENPAGDLGQDCIVINVAVALLDRQKEATAFKSWCLEVPDHASARKLQRAGMSCDLARALLQATDHFLAADTAIIAKHVDANEVFYLPCGSGLLLCSPIYCRTPEDKYFVYSRARTWISASMVRPDQFPLSAATDATRSQLLCLIDIASS